jgi:hypothetical protein
MASSSYEEKLALSSGNMHGCLEGSGEQQEQIAQQREQNRKLESRLVALEELLSAKVQSGAGLNKPLTLILGGHQLCQIC